MHRLIYSTPSFSHSRSLIQRALMLAKNALTAKFSVALLLLCPIFAIAQPQPSVNDYLRNIVASLLVDDYPQALHQVDSLNTLYPTFQAGWVIRGDVLSVLAGVPAPESTGALASQTDRQQASHLSAYRNEIITRINLLQRDPPAERVPNILLSLPADEPFYLLSELSTSRLFLVPNPASKNARQRLTTFYVSQGAMGADKIREGDNRTPIGIYALQSFLSAERLLDFYGAGAYPLNYPNAWDKLHQKTGYGIWIHGVPRHLYSRPPLSTNGCLALSNNDLLQVNNAISAFSSSTKLPVIAVTNTVEWVSPDEINAQRESLTRAIEQWRKDWSARHLEAYLSHYASSFHSPNGDLAEWKTHKNRVFQGLSKINVRLADLTLFRYPNEDHLYWVRFVQDYQSNTMNQTSTKEQFWRHTTTGWKIVYEGAHQANAPSPLPAPPSATLTNNRIKPTTSLPPHANKNSQHAQLSR